jgi:succinate dehydrogenase/fumarate reductase flavoprotein subunit
MAVQHTADVLIVGGSLAGLAAAITAKESKPEQDVLVVEKYTAGYAGKANRGAGCVGMLGEYTAEEFMKYQIRHIGKYLNDQDALRQYAENQNTGVSELDRWTGGQVQKNPDGSVRTLKWRAQITGEDENGKRTFNEDNEYPWTCCAIDLDYTRSVRKHAARAGVRFVDRVGIVDLLKSDDGERVGGAIGYDIDTGERHAFAAKGVVLACGGQNYRVLPMWSPGRGEGIAAAWRAGASLSNGEFGPFFNWISPESFESSMGVEYALYNDKGENVGLRHTKEPHPDIDQDCLAEWYKQMRDGNGPLHYRVQENILMPYLTSVLASTAYYERPYADRFWGYLFFNAFSQQATDEIVPGLIGEYGPLKVDLLMRTTVPGLFAAGDICYGGTRACGAAPVPPGRVRGGGLAFAIYSGRMSGKAVSAYAAEAEPIAVSGAQTAAIDARFTAPLKRTGAWTVNAFVAEIQKVMCPLGNSLYRSEARMRKALDRVSELKSETGNIHAKDPHRLFGVNEIESMLLCAELFFRASLARKESIGWFLREDYPEPSGELKWIVLENRDGEPAVYTEDVPVERYPYKPQ